jgi:predicted alpha/beta hydrolase family esterase
VRALADSWGSRFIDIGPVGHLNPASGYGEWPGAEALLDVLGGMRRARAAVGAPIHVG